MTDNVLLNNLPFRFTSEDMQALSVKLGKLFGKVTGEAQMKDLEEMKASKAAMSSTQGNTRPVRTA